MNCCDNICDNDATFIFGMCYDAISYLKVSIWHDMFPAFSVMRRLPDAVTRRLPDAMMTRLAYLELSKS